MTASFPPLPPQEPTATLDDLESPVADFQPGRLTTSAVAQRDNGNKGTDDDPNGTHFVRLTHNIY